MAWELSSSKIEKNPVDVVDIYRTILLRPIHMEYGK